MADMLFMPLNNPLETILRALLVYLFLLAVFRVIGRHEFGRLSPFDLILLLIISESISPSLTAEDDSIATAFISAGTLFALAVALSYGKYKSPWFKNIVSAPAIPAIKNGVPVYRSLERELMTVDDLESALRAKGIDTIEKVRLSYIEGDGEISAILFEEPLPRRQIQQAAVHEESKPD
ncbi:MAG: DUF421 domain-containing protein [Methanobacteriota archaeon]|nr:MAG: DUF421 domain-containing protein [Euryarchaeota archaeon]